MSVEVNYVDEGPDDGEIVVLSGSLGSTLRMWDPQVEPLLRNGFRVIRYDHRGHGGSPAPDGPYHIAELAGDALALLDRIGARRVHWVGLSLGGMVGMWLASHAADRLRKLVLCCTSAKLGPPDMWRDRAALVRAEGPGAVADASVGRWLTPGFVAANPDTATWLRDMIATTPAEGYASCCTAIEQLDQLADLPSITAPTLVICGAQDPSCPAEGHGWEIANRIPGARLEELSPGAHLVSVEQPGPVSDLIVTWLEAA
jgi:3-oxoadipate enol-lactonase